MFRAHVLTIRRSKLHYTASGIITPIGGRLVQGLRESSLSLCKIALYSLWYHHIYRWQSRAQFERVLSQPVHETATYRCDDTRGCVMQF